MVMSTISSAPTAPRGTAGYPWVIGLAATLKRWSVAYIAWRIEAAAIAQLSSMSDRELKDMGLTRSGIAVAVKGGALRDRAFTRCY
jgi:uncharacterized protein YjiS (DUF1127 family)